MTDSPITSQKDMEEAVRRSLSEAKDEMDEGEEGETDASAEWGHADRSGKLQV